MVEHKSSWLVHGIAQHCICAPTVPQSSCGHATHSQDRMYKSGVHVSLAAPGRCSGDSVQLENPFFQDMDSANRSWWMQLEVSPVVAVLDGTFVAR